MKRFCLIALALLLSYGAGGCTDKSLAGAAERLDQIGKIAVSAQQLVVGLNSSGVLSDDETRPLMDGFRRVGQAGLAATTVVKGLQAKPEFTQDDRAQVAAALEAVQSAVAEVTVSGAIGIKNADSQRQVQLLIGNLVGLTNSLVDAFVAQFGAPPTSYAEVAHA